AVLGLKVYGGDSSDDDDDDDSFNGDSGDSGNKPTGGPNDPLVKRSAHVDEILANLEKVLGKFKRKAIAVL
ncbi:hypothetical protein LPJ67_005254, partial [Coemansia sp. RSA 1938]